MGLKQTHQSTIHNPNQGALPPTLLTVTYPSVNPEGCSNLLLGICHIPLLPARYLHDDIKLDTKTSLAQRKIFQLADSINCIQTSFAKAK